VARFDGQPSRRIVDDSKIGFDAEWTTDGVGDEVHWVEVEV
jgi:hypothetical protein